VPPRPLNGIALSHLLHVLLVQNLLHRQQLDDPLGPLVKRGAFAAGVFAVAEGDEELALPAAFAFALR
jgi:hypothetical protein